MLFVNISQAPYIISAIVLMVLFIALALYRQLSIQSKLFSKSQQKALFPQSLLGIKIVKLIMMI